MNNDDDLYSDLPEETTSDYLAKVSLSFLVHKSSQIGHIFYHLSLTQLETELKSIRKELDKMDTALTNSEKERKELLRLNEILKRNMSSLFKTAQSEIKRKENEISELRTQFVFFFLHTNFSTRKNRELSLYLF